ncbi:MULTISPECIES: hypothetical protein [Nitrosomonas]|uniref:Uncharacterized protein n=1 Tax=Nitrosomonas communis TaxID=44574 RepID=A0A0F7KD15_9PROT|nr:MULTISPECIES: hypothetical protein [Nitrosomonas]AKH36577.1 hypothetical protein AAW31_00060 [Nitrosomonas communis]AKH39336.1 hypothetical protein AAW31_18390 [Nitrosomonas communis]UVS61561.1 hypothetical protein NX761_19255 [Nitrosomonas sp. PLL12]UVS61585.1 hypothetical protein NX761_00055 [Nitrosomonas sp. PLL12]
MLTAHGIAFSITYTRALHIGDDSIANLCRVGLARLHSACVAASGSDRLQVATHHPCQFVCIKVLMDSFMVDEQFIF